MTKPKYTYPAIFVSLILLLTGSSCHKFSELYYKPFVMATAATYSESGQSSELLRFTIVCWADDVSGLEVNIYNPSGDLEKTWAQPAGTLSSGSPVKIDGIPQKTGGWRITFKGKVETNNDNRGSLFEDEVIVSVED